MFSLPLRHRGEHISNSGSAKCLEIKQTGRFGFLHVGFCLLGERGGLSSLPEEAFQEAFWGGERRRRWEGVVGVFVQGLLFKYSAANSGVKVRRSTPI